MPGSNKFAKLEHKNTNGVFLGSTATDNNTYFEDGATKEVLISKHVKFDKAHFSVPWTHIPLGRQSLQRTGYSNENDTETNQPVLI